MIEFPNAKINLGLYITEKRKDGYHNIATLFYPVPLTDSLEILPDTGVPSTVQALPAILQEKIRQFPSLEGQPAPVEGHAIRYSQSGRILAGRPGDNLCIRAYDLLKKDFPHLPAILMHLHKDIPAGAGLGGGSADGAWAIRMLNRLFDLQLSQQQMLAYAAALGSDCPFFILNRPAIGTGRGEILQPVDVHLKGYFLVLIHPAIHIPTAEAFRQIEPAALDIAATLYPLLQASPHHWKDRLINAFEPSVFAAYPVIGALKQLLYDKGAVYASMTGSGSTLFGIFEKPVLRAAFSLPENYLFYGLPF